MLILLRHGRTHWNANDPSGDNEILRGNNPTVDLDAQGRLSVHEAAMEMRGAFAQAQFVEVRSSNFARDATSRTIAAKALEAPEREDPRLAPFDPGGLSEKPVALIWDLMALLMEAPTLVPYDGESVGDWFRQWSDLFSEGYQQFGKNDQIAAVWIVHGMEMRSLAVLTGTGEMEKYRKGTIEPGEFVVFH